CFTNITNLTTYTIAETAQTGWTLGPISCSVASGTANGGKANPSGASVDIDLKEGEEWTCTYTNTKQGSIKIVKNTVGGDATFNFTSNFGVSSILTSGNTGSQTVDNLVPGSSYSISETAKTGWDSGT